MKKLLIFVLIWSSALFGVSIPTVQMQQVSPNHYRGQCPVSVRLKGFFAAPTPGTYRYRFAFSDGSKTPWRAFHTVLPKGVRVSARHRFNADFNGRVQLIVRYAGTNFRSSMKHLSIKCTQQGGSQGNGKVLQASVLPMHRINMQCPGTFLVRGRIKTNGAATVRYRFSRLDGKRSPIKTVRFGRAGTFVVSHHWPNNHKFYTKVRLEVLSPNQVFSSYKQLSVFCKNGNASGQMLWQAVVFPLHRQQACPAKFMTRGQFRHGAGVVVRYRFRRSDGKVSPWRSKTFMQEGTYLAKHQWNFSQSVATKFRLELRYKAVGSPGGWKSLNSSWKTLKVNCQNTPTARVSDPVMISPLHRQFPSCPANFTVRGKFHHKAGVTVRYRFRRSDGKVSPWRSKNFMQAGTYLAKQTWIFPQGVSTKIRLELRYKAIGSPGGWKSLNSPWRTLKVICQNAGPIVGHLSLNATPASFEGACPKTIYFNGKIHLNKPAMIRYRFLRSDGSKGPVRVLQANQAGNYLIHGKWKLNHSVNQGWVRFKVLHPEVRYSPKASFHLRCLPAHQVTQTTLKIFPPLYTGQCPTRLKLRGTIVTNAPGIVRYRFIGSNGLSSPWYAHHFNTGVHQVWYKPLVTQSSIGWFRLKISNPNPILSPKASYTVACVPAGTSPQGGGDLGTPPEYIPIPVPMPGTSDQTPPPQDLYTPPVQQQPTPPSTSDDDSMVEESPTETSMDKNASTASEGNTTVADDADGDGIEDNREALLLERYRPYFRFASEEKLLPSDPIYQLRYLLGLYASPFSEGTPLLQMPPRLQDCNITASHPEKILECNGADLSITMTPVSIAPDLNDSLRGDPGGGTPDSWDDAIALSPGLYGHVLPEGNLTRIEYWQYFPYSSDGKAQATEGDWQMLSLLVDPSKNQIKEACHRVYGRLICFDMDRVRSKENNGSLTLYHGPDFNRSIDPIDPASKQLMPPAYQNNALYLYTDRTGAQHPVIFVERGTHAFWPYPWGAYADRNASNHLGDGHRYLSTLNGKRANLGEFAQPLEDPAGTHALILHYGGLWGAQYRGYTRPAPGPVLHCGWHFPPEATEYARKLSASCRH